MSENNISKTTPIRNFKFNDVMTIGRQFLKTSITSIFQRFHFTPAFIQNK